MIHSQEWRYLRKALIAALLIAAASKPLDACTYDGCTYEAPSTWETIERMGVGELAVTLILVAFLALLVTISVSRGRAIMRAASQTRRYESRALTALYYDRADEAVSVADLFPCSPVAAVVSASLLKSAPLTGSTSRHPGSSDPVVQGAVIAQTIELKRRRWILAAIAWSAPVLALTTVINSSAYAVNIPFYLGMLIAAPALWLHRGLSGEVELLLHEVDRLSVSIIDQIDNQMRAIDKRNDDGALFGS